MKEIRIHWEVLAPHRLAMRNGSCDDIVSHFCKHHEQPYRTIAISPFHVELERSCCFADDASRSADIRVRLFVEFRPGVRHGTGQPESQGIERMGRIRGSCIYAYDDLEAHSARSVVDFEKLERTLRQEAEEFLDYLSGGPTCAAG